MPPLDQIKAIESDFWLFWGLAPEGTAKHEAGKKALSFFREKLIALLEADVVRLEGLRRLTRDLESTYWNRFIDSEIAHRRAVIKSLKE